MTNEKRLEALYYLARTTSGDLYPVEDMIKNPAAYERSSSPILAAFAAVILDTLGKMDKKTTPAATLAALKRITNTDDRTRGTWTDRDGWNIIGSPYMAIRIRDPFPASIPERTPDQGTPPDFSRIFTGAETAHGDFSSAYGYREFTPDELPTPAELKAHCAAHGMRRNSRGGKPYTISTKTADGKPVNIGISPYLLQDLREALPGAKLYHAGPVDMIHALDPETGDLIGLLCPVRVEQPAAENVA
jgi:hypothetical protein